MSLDELTDWRTDWQKHETFSYISYILGFTFYGVITVNQFYCGYDMLHSFMDEKRHQLVTYPVCKVPKNDFYVIWPQVTGTEQSNLAISYLAIGWPLAGNPLSIGWLFAGYWLAIGWLSAIYPLSIGWLLAMYHLAIGWLWAGYQLDISWRLAGYWLALGWL